MSENDSTRPVDPALSPRSLPRHVVPKLVAVLLVTSLLIVSLLCVAGLTDAGSFRYLGYAAVLGVVASLLWLVVESQRDRPAGQVSPFAWIAFPLSVLMFAGQVPFLAIAVYPPILEFLDSKGHVRASFVHDPDGVTLEIRFPSEVESRGNNLRLNDQLIPSRLFKERSDLFRWKDGKTLSLDIAPLRELLELAPVTSVSVNSDSQVVQREEHAWPFVYQDGGARVQPVTLDVNGAE